MYFIQLFSTRSSQNLSSRRLAEIANQLQYFLEFIKHLHIDMILLQYTFLRTTEINLQIVTSKQKAIWHRRRTRVFGLVVYVRSKLFSYWLGEKLLLKLPLAPTG